MRKRWDEIMRRLPANQKVVVAEVGAWRGKMSGHLLQSMPNVILYMIDRWECPPPNDSYSFSGSEISQRPQSDFDRAFHECVNLAYQFPGRAHIVKDDSPKAAIRFQNQFFDLVFIDGDHSYQGCRKDIIAWLPKVKKGGYISGHDYNHPNQGAVKKAVDEIFKREQIKLADNRTWFVKI